MVLSLSFPTDIKWERMCVSEDMMSDYNDDHGFPLKWRTSIALFKYIPEEEYQVYPGRIIMYFKVVCTITGYQPAVDEIEGQIMWDGVTTGTIDNLDNILSSFLPCNGAIIQVVVEPITGPRDRDGTLLTPRDQYPYIMDFQPMKRELFETKTDTQERMSRSANSLTVGKSGTPKSNEVLDIEPPTGSGITTKKLSIDADKKVVGTTDQSREQREGESHTTQISQLYHLLDSYHLGTNRVVFFVQARPHTVEEASTFVRGPRGIEGIQEFFLVVNNAKDQADNMGISVIVDTGHLISYWVQDNP